MFDAKSLFKLLILGAVIALAISLIRSRNKKDQTQRLVGVLECAKCHQATEIGKKFCPECGASLVSS